MSAGTSHEVTERFAKRALVLSTPWQSNLPPLELQDEGVTCVDPVALLRWYLPLREDVTLNALA